MDLNNKSVLVTGAGGFIGSHLVETLVERGAVVKALVRYNSRNNLGCIEYLSEAIKDVIKIEVGDLRDLSTAIKAVDGVDIVFHLASYTGIPYSYVQPIETIESNVIGTTNVLVAVKKNKSKVVFVSSSEVYGTAEYVPIDENHPLQPQSPYSASKIGAEMIVRSFYLSYDLPAVIVRPFNTYGPRQFARDLIPTIITQALTNKEIKLGSLYSTRDLTYVEDTVNGIISCSDASVGEIINIGSGCEISVLKLAKKIINMLEKDIEIVIDQSRIRPEKSEVRRLKCDYSKAKRLLGWFPQCSLDDGLHDTIDWVCNNMNLYKPSIYNI